MRFRRRKEAGETLPLTGFEPNAAAKEINALASLSIAAVSREAHTSGGYGEKSSKCPIFVFRTRFPELHVDTGGPFAAYSPTVRIDTLHIGPLD